MLDAFAERIRREHERIPEPLSSSRVERGEDFAPARVENGEARGAVGIRVRGQGPPQSIEGARSVDRQTGAGRKPPRGRQADPNPGERSGSDSDGEHPNRLPAPGRPGRSLDLGEQGGRVARRAVGPKAEQHLVQHVPAAGRANRGVRRRRVETNDGPSVAAFVSQ